MNEHFGDVLDEYMREDGRHARQLEQVSEGKFGEYQKVAHGTISRWRRGEVRKPRDWRPIVKIAIILRLTELEANRLLLAAGHMSVRNLQEVALTAQSDAQAQMQADEDAKLLAHWDEEESEVPFQVLPDIPFFVGRQEELQTLTNVLIKHERFRICYLYGMGGVGKTGLAVRLAYQLRDHFTDGVLWVSLPQVKDTMSVLHNFAEALGEDVSRYRDLSSRSSKVRSLLATKRVLLILDDVATDEDIQALLPPTGACAVIITTRRRDLVVADQAYCLAIRPFDSETGVELLTKILGRGVSSEQETIFANIATQLGHLPLALNIVARRIHMDNMATASAFLERLTDDQQRPRLLNAAPNRSINLFFDLSYQALSQEHQTLFAILGLFPQRDFSLDMVAFVADWSEIETADALYQLQSLSLVETGVNGRYRIHPLLHDYSQTKEVSPESQERFVTFFVAYVQTYTNDHPQLYQDMNNILGSFQVAERLGYQEAFIEGVLALFPFLKAQGLYKTAESSLWQAEGMARTLVDHRSLILILKHLGTIAVQQGQLTVAHYLYTDALDLAQTEQSADVGNLFTQLGLVARRQGDYMKAQAYYEQALQIATDDYRIAILQVNLGVIASAEGDLGKAESCYRKALQLARKLNDKSQLLTTALQNLGSIMDKRGNYEAASKYLQEGLTLAQNLDNPQLESRLLLNLGLVAYELGNYTDASSHFKKGINLAQRTNQHLQLCRHYTSLGLVKVAQGHFQVASIHYADALALAEKLESSADICLIHNYQGEFYIKQKRLQEARKVFQEAYQITKKISLQVDKAKSLYGLARIHQQLGNLEQAHQMGQESEILFTRANHKRADEVRSWLQELPKL